MENILAEIIELLGGDRVLTERRLAESYNHIWTMDQPLKAKALLLPKSTLEVSEIMKICYRHNQPVMVFGGRTNLVGGTETNGDEIVISMERLNQISELDTTSRTVTVEAGVILENLHTRVGESGLMFPLNFGAKGSAQLGGIIASNAGGLRVFRYGMTRNLVLGLEAVLSDGTIVSSLKKLIKDNSGYDLKQHFIGSEGTLGIVTKAVLRLYEQPQSRNSALIGLNDYTQVVQLLKFMDAGLAGTLSGFELMWTEFYTAGTTPPADPKPPLPQGYAYYVLLESMGSDILADRERLEDLLGQALEQNLIEDAVMADSQSDLNWFWKIREDVHACISKSDYSQHFDISLPIDLIGQQLEQMRAALLAVIGVSEVYVFGHIADGNIHLIVDKVNESLELKEQINKAVYSPLKNIGGSVSAEHGIGLHKKAYLHLCRTPQEITLMQSLKRAFDPKGILNRDKIIDFPTS